MSRKVQVVIAIIALLIAAGVGLSIIPPLMAALGAGLLAHAGLSSVVHLFRYVLLRRRERIRNALIPTQEEEESELPDEEELYDVPDVAIWMPVAAGMGFLLTVNLLNGPVRVVGLAAGVLPMLWKNRRMSRARQDVRRQVVHMIEEIRLRLAFGGSLGGALRSIADEERESVLHDRLQEHRDLMTVSGPEAVLEQVAEELRSSELKDLLRRISAARRGGASYTEALRSSTKEVTEETTRRAEREIEGAPLRLLLPMLAFLLPPVLAVVFYPPAYNLINQLTGVGGPKGGF